MMAPPFSSPKWIAFCKLMLGSPSIVSRDLSANAALESLHCEFVRGMVMKRADKTEREVDLTGFLNSGKDALTPNSSDRTA